MTERVGRSGTPDSAPSALPIPAPDTASEQPLETLVQKKETRRLRAHAKPGTSDWFGLGLFGLVGWSVAVPSVLGIALGLWLDERFAGRPSWTLSLLFVGVVLGCLNAWYWIQQERRDE